MPQAAPFVTAFLYGTAATASATLLAAAALGSLVQIAIINFALGALGKALGQKGAQGKLAPINVTIRGSAENRRLVFGTVRAGGVIVYYNSAGTNKQFLYYVIAYAGHQVSAIKDIWLDNTKILHANINAGTGAVTQTNYTGKLSIWRYTGTSTQTADSTLTTAFSGTWTSSFKLQGIAYALIRMERDDKAFPNGAPQAITALVDGALMYDPRLDSTNGGSGSHRYTDATTWTFPTNPSGALALRWFLTGGSVTNTVATPQVMYGPRELNSRMNDTYFMAAANKCDEVLTGVYTTPAGDQYRYSFNMECTTGQSRREIIEAMLSSMAGVCPLVNGKWRPYAGSYDAPTHVLTDADVYGDIEIIDTSDNEDRFNAVSASFRDSTNLYVEATTILRTDSTYETQDNGERIPRMIALPGVVTDPAAQRLVEIEKRKTRLMRVVKIPGALNLLKIAPYETFTFSNTKYSWSNRVFRLLERQFEFGEEAGRVVVTARVEDSAVYTDMLTASYNTANTHTPISNVELPDPATSLTATTVSKGIQFAVGLPGYLDSDALVQLYEYTANTPFASASLIAEFRGSVFILPKADETTRYYWVSLKNKATLQSSVEFPTSANGVAGAAALIVAGHQTSTPADGSQAYSSGTAPVVEVSGLSGHVSYTAPAAQAAQVLASWSAQSRIDNTTSGVAVGAAYIFVRVQVNAVDVWSKKLPLEIYSIGDTSWGILSGSQSFDVPAGQVIDLYLQTGREFTTAGFFPAQTMYWRDAILDLFPTKG